MKNNYAGLTRMQWRKQQPAYKRWQRVHNKKLKSAGYFHARYVANKGAFKRRGEEYRDKLRIETFAHYGTICYCCKEQNPLFLSLGHVNNDGAAHRRTLPKGVTGGYSFYLWLKKNKYPPLPLQVECYNCNCGKFRNHGVCPHVNL